MVHHACLHLSNSRHRVLLVMERATVMLGTVKCARESPTNVAKLQSVCCARVTRGCNRCKAIAALAFDQGVLMDHEPGVSSLAWAASAEASIQSVGMPALATSGYGTI